MNINTRREIEALLNSAEPSAQLVNLFIIMQAKMVAYYYSLNKGDEEISILMSISPESVKSARGALGLVEPDGIVTPSLGKLLIGSVTPTKQQMYAQACCNNMLDTDGNPLRVKPQGDPIWLTTNAIRDGVTGSMLLNEADFDLFLLKTSKEVNAETAVSSSSHSIIQQEFQKLVDEGQYNTIEEARMTAKHTPFFFRQHALRRITKELT